MNRMNRFVVRRLLTKYVAAAVLTLVAHAQTVYFTPNGKTFHTSKDCIALTRSKTIMEADQKEAKAHGLKACGICQRRKSTAAKATTANSFGKVVK